jgi:hypothetical protein
MEQAKPDDRGIDTALAILISLFMPTFVFTLIWLFASAFLFGPNTGTMPSPIFILVGVLFFLGYLIFAYAALVIIGLPLFQIIYFLGIRGRWPYVMFGFLAGGILPFFCGNPVWVLHQHISPLCAAIGAATAWNAWSIRRPDLDPA